MYGIVYIESGGDIMFKFFRKLLTKNNTRIPLYRVYFDLEAHRRGELLSCKAYLNPEINKLSSKNKDEMHKHMKIIADIIRKNLDVEEL